MLVIEARIGHAPYCTRCGCFTYNISFHNIIMQKYIVMLEPKLGCGQPNQIMAGNKLKTAQKGDFQPQSLHLLLYCVVVHLRQYQLHQQGYGPAVGEVLRLVGVPSGLRSVESSYPACHKCWA